MEPVLLSFHALGIEANGDFLRGGLPIPCEDETRAHKSLLMKDALCMWSSTQMPTSLLLLTLIRLIGLIEICTLPMA